MNAQVAESSWITPWSDIGAKTAAKPSPDGSWVEPLVRSQDMSTIMAMRDDDYSGIDDITHPGSESHNLGQRGDGNR